jgi:Uma2 family endonuclease
MTIEIEQLRLDATPAQREPPPGKMTYEEFLAWADEDTLAEWVDGEVIMYSPSSRRHQELANFLNILLSFYVSKQGLGKVLMPPFQVKLWPDGPGREPDLIFIAGENLRRLQEMYLDGPADLLVEITSPESGRRDRGDKFYEYEKAGVGEYWLIDPEREQAEFYRLDERGRYQIVPVDADATYRSQVVPGFWLRVDWLWRDPPPTAVEALQILTRMLPDLPGLLQAGL